MTAVFPPEAIRVWMNLLQNGAFVPITKLEKCLLPLSVTADDARHAVKTATKLGILVPKQANASGRGRSKGTQVGFCKKLPVIPKSSRDRYCFECHLAKSKGSEGISSELKHCPSCVRSFHAVCHRKDPHKPTYPVPSHKGQSYRLPVNESDTDLEDDIDNSTIITNNIDNSVPRDNELLFDHNSNINTSSHPKSFLKHEHDDDVFFVSEQPALVRRRKLNDVKSEIQLSNDVDNTDVDMELELCTACRLRKLAALQNPPHLGKEELSCLLDFSWKIHQRWLATDVRKYMTKQWSVRDASRVKRLLFRNDILGVLDISEKIAAQKYKYLTELLIDLVDLQHNIGVFFGTKCQEYTATKWLLRDVTYDIREIRRCPDCYRFSSEANRSNLWFAKPCLQRHELVYAKQSGSPPWPAKVIRVLTRKSDKYDVRFFGGSHSRAIVAARDILPIDADISQYRKKNSRSLTAALQELRCHQLLSRYSAEYFAFHSNPRTADELIQVALRHYTEGTVADRNINTTPTLSTKKKRNLHVSETTSVDSIAKRLRPTTPGRTTRQRKCAAATPAAPIICSEGEHFNEVNSNDITIASGFGDYQQLTSEILVAHQELIKCKSELANMKLTLDAAKRQRWCYYCLKEATFDCCFSASYCSIVCQRKDKRTHLIICKAKQ